MGETETHQTEGEAEAAPRVAYVNWRAAGTEDSSTQESAANHDPVGLNQVMRFPLQDTVEVEDRAD